jgi:hypothetical protein
MLAAGRVAPRTHTALDAIRRLCEPRHVPAAVCFMRLHFEVCVQLRDALARTLHQYRRVHGPRCAAHVARLRQIAALSKDIVASILNQRQRVATRLLPELAYCVRVGRLHDRRVEELCASWVKRQRRSHPFHEAHCVRKVPLVLRAIPMATRVGDGDGGVTANCAPAHELLSLHRKARHRYENVEGQTVHRVFGAAQLCICRPIWSLGAQASVLAMPRSKDFEHSLRQQRVERVELA